MFEQDSALAHRACKMVVFLDHEMPDFMFSCCLVLTRSFIMTHYDISVTSRIAKKI